MTAAGRQRFEAPLDLAAAAAEVGLPGADFEARLRRSATQARLLGPLLVRGGTVQRSAFEAAFSDVLREFRPGVLVLGVLGHLELQQPAVALRLVAAVVDLRRVAEMDD